MAKGKSDIARTDLDDIPLADLRRRIASFRAIDPRRLEPPQIQSRIGRIIDRFPIFQEHFMVNRVIRARLNKPGEIFAHTDQLWYPPKEFAQLNRLSYAGEPIFYAADAAATVLYEIGASPGSIATIIACDSVTGTSELTVGFIGATRSKSSLLDATGYMQRRLRLQQQLGPSQFRKYEMIDELLSDLMTTPVADGEQHKYQATAALGKILFGAPLDGLQYPSVKTDLQGLNLALRPGVADKHFKGRVAWMLEFGQWATINGRRMLATWPLRSSKVIGEDGKIVWTTDFNREHFERFVSPPIGVRG